MLYPPFKNLRSSVRPSVRPSALHFNSLPAIFFKLGIRVDIGKECLGIADG